MLVGWPCPTTLAKQIRGGMYYEVHNQRNTCQLPPFSNPFPTPLPTLSPPPLLGETTDHFLPSARSSQLVGVVTSTLSISLVHPSFWDWSFQTGINRSCSLPNMSTPMNTAVAYRSALFHTKITVSFVFQTSETHVGKRKKKENAIGGTRKDILCLTKSQIRHVEIAEVDLLGYGQMGPG